MTLEGPLASPIIAETAAPNAPAVLAFDREDESTSDSLALDLAECIGGSNLHHADKVDFLVEFLRANFDTVQDAADDAGIDLGEERGPDPWTRLANELLAWE